VERRPDETGVSASRGSNTESGHWDETNDGDLWRGDLRPKYRPRGHAGSEERQQQASWSAALEESLW